MLYNICHVTLYIMCHVMMYNMCHVMLYNICHVMLYNIKYFMLYNICYVMLYNLKYVMLYNIKICYVMTSKLYFISMQLYTALKKCCLNKTPERKRKLRSLSQTVKVLVTTKHQLYLTKIEASFKNNPKHFWSYHKASLGG